MATISSPGIGSGLDIQSIVKQMLSLEQRPLTQLQNQATATRAQLSAFGQLQSQVANLQDQASRLASPGLWNTLAATSSNSAAVSASVTSAATPTSFSVQVAQLAGAQSTASATITQGTDLSGKLTISLGQWSGVDLDPATTDNPLFEEKADTLSVDIDIEPSDSLAAIASKINSADAGVSATVLRDSTGERLLFRSSSTGEVNGFRITAEPEDGSSLQALAYDPENAINNSALTVLAQDTVASVNGVEIRSASNRFEGVVTGVNLVVSQVTAPGTPVEVSVRNDTAGVRSAIRNFVESYNALSGALSEMTKYDAATKTAGSLQGDSTAVGLQNALRRLVSSNTGSAGEIGSLSAIGISFSKTGALAIDDDKLNTALNQPAALKNFLMGEGDAPGLAAQVRDFARGIVGIGGSLSSRNSSLQASIDRNNREQDRVKDRLVRVEERLLKQYSTLDANISQLTALNNYVAQQVTTWNNQKR
jgi:flagellar hook-associated protein 2